jgi:hypothetical protein
MYNVASQQGSRDTMLTRAREASIDALNGAKLQSRISEPLERELLAMAGKAAGKELKPVEPI